MKEKDLSEDNKKTKAKDKKVQKIKKPSRIKQWIRELKAELKKIVWPTKKQVTHNTLIVLGTVIVSVIGISGLDFVFTFVYDVLINLG